MQKICHDCEVRSEDLKAFSACHVCEEAPYWQEHCGCGVDEDLTISLSPFSHQHCQTPAPLFNADCIHSTLLTLIFLPITRHITITSSVMKRTRSQTAGRSNLPVYEDGAPLERQPATVPRGGLVSPPLSPGGEGRPSKLRRHGSKFMSVLRSLTNSGMSQNPAPKSQTQSRVRSNYLYSLTRLCRGSSPFFSTSQSTRTW